MRKRTLWIAGTLAAVAAASANPDEVARARKRLARWNPVFMALIIAMIAIIFWPWG